MTRKGLDASREARLWITQVVIPAGALLVGVMNIPEVKQAIATKVNDVKENLKSKFKRG